MTPVEFDALWAQRHLAAALSACETFLKNQLSAQPEYDWLWRAAAVEYHLGLRAADSGQETAALAHWDAAAQHAAAADAARFGELEAPFWRGISTLEAALARGSLAAARAFGPAEKWLEKAAFLDESYQHAGPLRELGRICRRRPLLLGGNLDRSIAFLKHAHELAPNNTTNFLYLADVYITDRQPKIARETLQALLEITPDEDWQWESERDKRIAREWLGTRFG
jgi:tetratricopeptide (TPR) repeat protein